jgi:hypothetical protein
MEGFNTIDNEDEAYPDVDVENEDYPDVDVENFGNEFVMPTHDNTYRRGTTMTSVK